MSAVSKLLSLTVLFRFIYCAFLPPSPPFGSFTSKSTSASSITEHVLHVADDLSGLMESQSCKKRLSCESESNYFESEFESESETIFRLLKIKRKRSGKEVVEKQEPHYQNEHIMGKSFVSKIVFENNVSVDRKYLPQSQSIDFKEHEIDDKIGLKAQFDLYISDSSLDEKASPDREFEGDYSVKEAVDGVGHLIAKESATEYPVIFTDSLTLLGVQEGSIIHPTAHSPPISHTAQMPQRLLSPPPVPLQRISPFSNLLTLSHGPLGRSSSASSLPGDEELEDFDSEIAVLNDHFGDFGFFDFGKDK